MKLVLSMMFFIAAMTLHAQTSKDCKFLKNVVDEFTGSEIKVLETVRLGKNKGYRLIGNMGKIEGAYGLYLTYSGELGCLTSDSYAILKFENGETIEVKNINDTDCGDDPQFIGLFDPVVVSLFKESRLIKLRYSLDKMYADIEITNPEYFNAGIYCLD